MHNTQKLIATLLLAAGTAAGQIGVTGFDNVRMTLVNTAPAIAPACTVTAALSDVTPASTTTTSFAAGIEPVSAYEFGDAAPMATIFFIGDCSSSSPPPLATFTLAPGQAATIDYSPVLPAGVRQQLRPTFTFANVLNCLRLAATVELIDSVSARTTILNPPTPILPILGPAGITGADTIRLNAVYPPTPIAPANPCQVQARLLAAGSTTVLAQNTFTLSPGQSAALEFSNATLGAGVRQAILPVARQVSALRTCPGVQANFELYDRASARTFAFAPPQPIVVQ